jgi:hypothetical protein
LRSKAIPGILVAVVKDSETSDALAALEGEPEDERLRERAARALSREGRHDDALRLLFEPAGRLRNLTAHTRSRAPLPCLCKKCMAQAPAEVSADGGLFLREFAVSGSRVLLFWMPATLRGQVKAVVHEVRSALAGKLRRKGAKATSGSD